MWFLQHKRISKALLADICRVGRLLEEPHDAAAVRAESGELLRVARRRAPASFAPRLLSRLRRPARATARLKSRAALDLALCAALYSRRAAVTAG